MNSLLFLYRLDAAALTDATRIDGNTTHSYVLQVDESVGNVDGEGVQIHEEDSGPSPPVGAHNVQQGLVETGSEALQVVQQRPSRRVLHHERWLVVQASMSTEHISLQTSL